ncbi:MAG: DNA methylase [Prevotella sp.]|nr:DNA methylase [Prevotella sp.]
MASVKCYVAIDLKSFYASVECVERGLDPLTTPLVVADESRTDKTICLAVSPSLKKKGISGRARLFEVLAKVNRKDFICAVPRMQLYIDYSVRIYQIYLKYFSKDDIHVYSIDEVFIDVTSYLELYRMSAHDLTRMVILDILKETGITATAGIGTNLYLCKVAMDIVAKSKPADADGVRIVELDESSYRRQLWSFKPLTSFWRLGKGTMRKLNHYGMYTMGDIAKQSVIDEDVLYSLFGVNAELLIDHAWGWEPCTMDEIKKYRPETNSLSSGQVLSSPYDVSKARVIVMEMAEEIAMQLLSKRLVTCHISLRIGYEKGTYKYTNVSAGLDDYTSSVSEIKSKFEELYNNNVVQGAYIRRMTLTVNHVIHEDDIAKLPQNVNKQLSLFNTEEEAESKMLRKEKKLSQAVLDIKRRFGKNAIVKGINFADGATMVERHKQIGGHRA